MEPDSDGSSLEGSGTDDGVEGSERCRARSRGLGQRRRSLGRGRRCSPGRGRGSGRGRGHGPGRGRSSGRGRGRRGDGALSC